MTAQLDVMRILRRLLFEADRGPEFVGAVLFPLGLRMTSAERQLVLPYLIAHCDDVAARSAARLARLGGTPDYDPEADRFNFHHYTIDGQAFRLELAQGIAK